MITQSQLDQFSGSDEIYSHWLKAFVYTDGVKFLADNANAYWLLDAIASHQTQKLLSDPMLKDFQIWILAVDGRKARLVCEKDDNIRVVTQDIVNTDFPLKLVKLYLVNKVLMLPSEY